MNDDALVKAILTDRAAYERLAGRLDPRDFGEFGKLVVTHAAQFYKRDPAAESVDLAVLESALLRSVASPKHGDSIVRYVRDLPGAASAANIAEEYRALKRHNLGLSLAANLGAGKHGDATDVLIERYRDLGVEHETDSDRLTVDQLLETVGEGKRIPTSIGRLNRALDGGLLRGHNITIYGRPESGKSAFAVNLAAGWLRQGLRVLYTGNEEPIRDLQLRFIARLSGVSLRTLRADPAALIAAADRANGAYELLIAKQLTTGKPAEIEALVRAKRPDVLVIDQLKNLKVPGVFNRAEALDNIAGEVRRLGIAYNMLTVSVTQAKGEAQGRLILEQGDIEWSSTGIPGAADLLIGIGVNQEYDAACKRMISLPKNKISGRHDVFPLFTDFDRSAYMSAPKKKRYST